jgi:uncharacterized membrane protein (UPF0127 family)
VGLTRDPVAFGALAVIVVFLVIAIYSTASTPGSVTSPVPTSFAVGGKTFAFTYTAITQDQRVAGLADRRIGTNTTMLFAFPTFGRWQFWMDSVNSSLDMVWVNATGDSGVVVYLVASAPPCFDSSSCPVYTPTAAANYVIEAQGGFAAANGIFTGVRIQFGSGTTA